MGKRKAAPAAEKAVVGAEAPKSSEKPVFIVLLRAIAGVGPQGSVPKFHLRDLDQNGWVEGEDYRLATKQDIARSRS